MGLYAIRCKNNKCKFNDNFLGNIESLQKKLRSKCPKCGEKKLFQSFESLNFKLMGGGWADRTYKQIRKKVYKPITGLDKKD